MKPVEEQIIKSLLKSKELSSYERYDNEKALEKLIQTELFGTTSAEFRNHPALDTLIKTSAKKDYLMLWLGIEDYLSNKNNIALVQEKLNHVETALKECLKCITPKDKAQGTAMLPKEIANAQFMRDLYLLNDENLSTLFLKYLPAPRAKVFKGHAIPEIIAKREQNSTKAIISVLERNENNLASVESKLIKVQRKFRAKKRKEENLQRLPQRYSGLWQAPNKAMAAEYAQKFATELLAEANKPYQPQCEENLSKRIMEAAKKVELFSTVRHLTAASALESIFNDGLYGRRSMMHFYMHFRPAALTVSDIWEGDANAVCLGTNEIDPGAKHGIELQFDAKKISANNPCVFYKQRDLYFELAKIRNVKIGELDLRFSHTETYRCQKPEVSSLVLYNSDDKKYAWADVTKAVLIADNIKEMHRILTLNFFRLVDKLTQSDCSEDRENKEKIYSALSKLSEQELIETLLQIGKNMTDSMEFNFYGAYKIDFSALLTIKNDDRRCSLNLPSFINELKAGNLKLLNDAMGILPEIFTSYRFIDYLLSSTNNEAVIAALQEQRKKCTLPAWIKEIDESIKPNL